MPARLKVLFVCAMNKQRSVTAERLYRNDPRLEVRSAGVNAKAARRISEADLNWADLVYVMESDQKTWIRSRFPDLDLPKIEVLDIPDEFPAMNPELQTMLRAMLDPEFTHLCGR
jgi:protein-tyrosine phosphatase